MPTLLTASIRVLESDNHPNPLYVATIPIRDRPPTNLELPPLPHLLSVAFGLSKALIVRAEDTKLWIELDEENRAPVRLAPPSLEDWIESRALGATAWPHLHPEMFFMKRFGRTSRTLEIAELVALGPWSFARRRPTFKFLEQTTQYQIPVGQSPELLGIPFGDLLKKPVQLCWLPLLVGSMRSSAQLSEGDITAAFYTVSAAGGVTLVLLSTVWFGEQLVNASKAARLAWKEWIEEDETSLQGEEDTGETEPTPEQGT